MVNFLDLMWRSISIGIMEPIDRIEKYLIALMFYSVNKIRLATFDCVGKLGDLRFCIWNWIFSIFHSLEISC